MKSNVTVRKKENEKNNNKIRNNMIEFIKYLILFNIMIKKMIIILIYIIL